MSHRSSRARRMALATLLLAAAACSSADGGTLAPAPSAATGGQGGGQGRIDLREVRAELLAADRAYSAASAAGGNFVEGLVATLAEDVIYLPAGGNFYRGREAVRTLLSSNPSNPFSTYKWTPVRGDVSADGTLGYTYGYYSLDIPPFNGRPARTALGKYAAAWRKENGAWKATVLLRNPRPEGPVSETPPAGYESPDTKHERHFPNDHRTSALESMLDNDRAFSAVAESSRDFAGTLAAFAAPDGATNGGGAEFAWGPDAIRADAFPPPAEHSFLWEPVEGDVAESGDLGFSVGIATERLRATGEVLGYTKYLSIWKRQNDGRWRFVFDAGSAMPPL
jgi:ketosteroid isomerase-like protein